jgi:DNA-binding NarL/FixJ family response regulator/Flp pilus assembly pilin Flp
MSEQQPLRVLVVDDHATIRAGIESLIDAEAPRMHSIGGAANSADALLLAKEKQPDVILLDVDLGGEDGLALIPLLHDTGHCGVLVLTSLADTYVVERARRCGANDFMLKTAPAGELIERIARLQRGRALCGSFHSNTGGAMSREAGNKQPRHLGNCADASSTCVTYSYSIDAAMHERKERSNVITDGLAAIRRMFMALWRDEQGVTSIEYGLLAALIAIACITSFNSTGTSLRVMYEKWTGLVVAAL